MIIAREYVTFGRLVSSNDEGGKFFLKNFISPMIKVCGRRYGTSLRINAFIKGI